ncbi:hypothetical protein RKD29_000354 [Streptomyces tendae]
MPGAPAHAVSAARVPWSGHVNPVRERAGAGGSGAEPVGPPVVPRPGAGTHRVLAHPSRTLRSAVVRISLRRRPARASGDGGGDDADPPQWST